MLEIESAFSSHSFYYDKCYGFNLNILYPQTKGKKYALILHRKLINICLQLYIGHAVTKVGSKSPSGWLNPHVIEDQMILNSKYSNIKGSVFWNMQHMIKNELNFKVIKTNPFFKYNCFDQFG